MNGAEQSPGGRRLTAILSVLLIHANHRVPVDTLMEAVWGDAVTPGTASTLESHLWRLRRIVEPSRGTRQASTVLVNDTGGYRLLVGEDDVDSLRFEKLADLTRDLLMRQDPDDAGVASAMVNVGQQIGAAMGLRS